MVSATKWVTGDGPLAYRVLVWVDLLALRYYFANSSLFLPAISSYFCFENSSYFYLPEKKVKAPIVIRLKEEIELRSLRHRRPLGEREAKIAIILPEQVCR